MSQRSYQALQSLGLTTVGELVRETEEALLGRSELDRMRVDEVKRRLALKGLRLGMEVD